MAPAISLRMDAMMAAAEAIKAEAGAERFEANRRVVEIGLKKGK